MEDPTKIPAPVTPAVSISDIATHFSYLRRDTDQNKIDMKTGFDEVKKSLESVNIKLDHLTDGYVTKMDFIELNKPIEDHEKRIRLLETATTKIITWGTAGVLALGIAEFLLSKFLK